MQHGLNVLGLPFLELRKEIAQALEAAADHDCEELAVKLGRLMDVDPENKEMSGVISTALTQTRWLDSRPVKASLEGRGATIDFAVMKERPLGRANKRRATVTRSSKP